MEKMDYKKEFKELYQPKETPSVIDVPEMIFIQVEGKGDPNDPHGEYGKAVELLYALSYTIRMMPRNGITPPGYFEYVVPPLEGLWWLEEGMEFDLSDKSKFVWTSMIRQPGFVTDELFLMACDLVRKKKKLDASSARLVRFTEGLCVQCLHLGPFSEEPETVRQMEEYIKAQGLISDLSPLRRHHEIYLSDPRKVKQDKLKTIIRHPVKV